MLRLASSKLVPTAFRAIASSNAFVSVANPGRCFSAVAKAHAAAQDKLVRALDTEIKIAQLMPKKPLPPADFPFKISHNTYNSKVVLSREMEGEVIEVRLLEEAEAAATETHHGGATTTDSDSDTCTDSDSDSCSDTCSDSVEERDESGLKSKSLPLKVDIIKPNGKSMKFAATMKVDTKLFGTSASIVSADEIAIERLTTKEGNKVICSQLYIPPEGELQTAFKEFLETRGVKQSIGIFLFDYMEWSSKLPCDFPRRTTFDDAARHHRKEDIHAMQTLKSAIENW